MIRHLTRRGRLAAIAVAIGAAAPAEADQTRAFVACTDFSSGSLANVSFGPPPVVTPNVATPSSDPVLRHFGALLYVVNRFNFDNIQVIDPGNGYTTVQQFSVGNGSNPTDIELVSPTKGYVARYDEADLWIVNPQTGAHTGTISLAGFADVEDGIPEMHRLAIRGGRLFVTVQRLDRINGFIPTDSSQVVVIDLATDTVVDANPSTPGVQGILLPLQNPNTELVVDPNGWLVVGCTGRFGVLDGGVVRIDPGTLAVAGTEITEATLGGDLNDVAPFTASRAFAVISNASFATLLKSYDRSTGSVTGTPYSTPDFSIADIEVNDRGELWVCDRSFANPGLRIFDAVTGLPVTASPLSTGLPPQDIAFDGAVVLGVVPSPPSLVSLVRSYPTPAAGPSSIVFRLAASAGEAEPVEVRVHDPMGRVIWTRNLGRLDPGEHRVTWEGRTSGGERVAPGAYILSVRRGASRGATVVIRI